MNMVNKTESFKRINFTMVLYIFVVASRGGSTSAAADADWSTLDWRMFSFRLCS